MGRKPRTWIEGAVYHITSRGNRRENIYREREDYEMYLQLLKNTMDKYPFKLICYCLMTNHIHLQLRIGEYDAGKIMSRTNHKYALYFNNKYNYNGHLFQERYFADIIKDDAQMVLVSRYIHLNPVRANLVKSPIDYEWSSFGTYMGLIEDDKIDKESVLNYFHNKRFLYKEFVDGEDAKEELIRVKSS